MSAVSFASELSHSPYEKLSQPTACPLADKHISVRNKTLGVLKRSRPSYRTLRLIYCLFPHLRLPLADEPHVRWLGCVLRMSSA